MNVVVYRGVLQRSRLRLLLAALADHNGPNEFIWISTRPTDREQVKRLEDVLAGVPGRYNWEILDGSLPSFFASRRRVSALLLDQASSVAVIGQSAIPYLPQNGMALTVCINGIPEERMLQRPGLRSRLRSTSTWLLYRGGMLRRSGSIAVTVSSRMSDLVRSRLGLDVAFEAPTAAGDEYFEVPLKRYEEREYDFCYQGSGAAWQNLEYLNNVWRSIALARPESRFLILSYDDRCRVLSAGLPEGSVEFIKAFTPSEVARQLSNSRVGFVLRTPDIVNRVSFPTKIGESLACGIALIVSDIDWDPRDLFIDGEAGVLVSPNAPASEVASAALTLLAAGSEDSIERSRNAAVPLRRSNVTARSESVIEQTSDGQKRAERDQCCTNRRTGRRSKTELCAKYAPLLRSMEAAQIGGGARSYRAALRPTDERHLL